MSSNDELFLAIENGEVDKVRKLLRDPNVRTTPLFATWNKEPVTLGPTALMVAMRAGQDEVAGLLLEKKADPLLKDQFGKTAGMYGLEFAHIDMESLKAFVSQLGALQKGFSDADHWGHNLLMYAALSGAPKIVDLIIDSDSKIGGSSVKQVCDDGDSKALDLLTLSAKHGKGPVIEKLLNSAAKSSLMQGSRGNAHEGARQAVVALEPIALDKIVKKVPRGKRGVSAALILACINGHWIEELISHVAHELDEEDSFGYTPIMHALKNGNVNVARKLIERGVDVKELVPELVKDGQGAGATAADAIKQSMLHVAIDKIVSRPHRNADEVAMTLALITDLVKADATTMIPPLCDRYYSTKEMYDAMKDTNHAIGSALSLGIKQVEAETVDFVYRTVRLMLATAFRDAPAAALCAFVALTYTMREHAEKVHLSDFELSQHLLAEAQEIGISVGEFIRTLSETERERLLRSKAGTNFLRFAAETQCRKMFFAPAISNHIELRWNGQLMHTAVGGADGVYQWGGKIELNASERTLLAMLVPVTWLANIALLPFVAVYPPLKDHVRAYLQTLGSWGVDLRESPKKMEGAQGYSPTLKIWFHSLLLIDTPMFKFICAQLGSLGLLAALFYLGPCFDFNNHNQCFAEKTPWHMIGDDDDEARSIFGTIFSALPTPDRDVFDDDYSYSSDTPGTDAGVVEVVSSTTRRMLKGGRARARASSGDDNDPGTGNPGFDSKMTIPHLWGFDKDTVYILMLVYVMMLLVSSFRAPPSIATTYSYPSAVGSVLCVVYFMLDLLPFYPLNVQFDGQGFALPIATFLIWCDVSRGILLKTFTAGPSTLMLMLMFGDVAKFLVIAVAVAAGFAVALYMHSMLRGGDIGSADLNCPFNRGSFFDYSYTLVEELLGISSVGDQVACAKYSVDFLSVMVLELYLVVAMILLLNMLIAMMAETFAEVRSRQEEEYNYLNSCIVVSADLDLGEIPPPLSVLRAPWAIWKKLRPDKTKGFEKLGETTTTGLRDDQNYDHASVDELLEKLAEADMISDKEDLPGLILSVKDAVTETKDILGQAEMFHVATGKKVSKSDDEVQVFDGYEEEASRLVFHYADHFQHLAKAPKKRTYLPSGINENEAEDLPIAPGPDEKLEKLQTRALTSYTFPQQVPMKAGEAIIAEMGEDSYVYKRANGEYGLSQIWPMKVEEKWRKNFTCSHDPHNPDPTVFQPQAVVEFKRTIDILFGAGATKKVPIMYAQNKKKNTKPLYKGSAEALETFLRQNPKACERLKIVKLYPGGFVTAVNTPKKDSYKQYDFMAGEMYYLYVKQGFETMACIKVAEQFDKECKAGPEISEMDLVERDQMTAMHQA